MKRTICLAVLLLMVLSSLFAKAPIFMIGAGMNIVFNNNPDIDDETSSTEDDIELDRFGVGLETRTILMRYIRADLVGEVSVIDKYKLFFSGLVAVGGTVDIKDILRLGITMGPRIEYIFADNEPNQSVQGSEKGRLATNLKSFSEAFRSGDFSIRLSAELIAGPVMTVGFVATIPTTFSIEAANYRNLFPPMERALEDAQLALSVQMRII